MFDVKRIESQDRNVAKFVFTNKDCVVESVLYKYPTYTDRTVICCSTQSGCPVGCRFCGAGDYFVRSLKSAEIIEQVDHCIGQTATDPSLINRCQIMFMSMGEPLLNRTGMLGALPALHKKYPKAALLISTIAPKIDYQWVIDISRQIPAIGLQFSIHKSTDEERNKLIPFINKLTLREIAEIGRKWHAATGRKPFINYCAADDNSSGEDAKRLASIFDPAIFCCTISVICERNEGLPARNQHQIDLAADFSKKMLALGYDVRVFDPAGQDDIGGGCGQLWFVQQWMRDNPDKARPSIGCGQPTVHTPHAVNG